MLLTDLDRAVARSGLDVVEVPGWRTRGHGSLTSVESITCHHTATSAAASGDYPTLGIVRDGRSDLPGPLSQLGLGRSGTVYIIASGVAFHAGATHESWMDNWHAIGIEAEHPGVGVWPTVQYDAYARLCAALCDHYGVPTARVLGHKEVATPTGRKVDPNFDMPAFRGLVDEERDVSPEQEDRIASKVVARLLAEELGNGETVKTNIRRGGDAKAIAQATLDRMTARWGDVAK
jgi:hypothetical protein